MTSYHDLLIQETRRRLFEESYPRIEKCLSLLAPSAVWHRPNANSNTVGNLILHLCGNVRQWIIAGLGQKADTRQRAAEFTNPQPISNQQLLDRLQELKVEVNQVLDDLQEGDLLKTYPVQVYEETGIAILVHVMEHFSYHVGQISYVTKAMEDVDLNYYPEVKE